MPVYCFVCNKCGNKFEEFFHTSDYSGTLCHVCESSNVRRDYTTEKPIVLDDIQPYFDFSIGEQINGRRDKATKYRNSGHTPLYGSHGGDVTVPYKTFYGDEQNFNKLNNGKKNEIEQLLERQGSDFAENNNSDENIIL